jgi:hypothetical protein
MTNNGLRHDKVTHRTNATISAVPREIAEEIPHLVACFGNQ